MCLWRPPFGAHFIVSVLVYRFLIISNLFCVYAPASSSAWLCLAAAPIQIHAYVPDHILANSLF
jgi:hypothetical protein